MPWAVAAAAVGAGASIYDQNQAMNAQKGAIAPLQQANSTAYGKAEAIANTPYTPYTGTQVAPLAAGQQEAIDLAKTNATNNEGGQDIGKAEDLAGQIAGNSWSSATAQKYMNPYTQNVTDVAQKQLNQQYANIQNQTDLNSASSGAFGGDRAALTKANNTGQYLYNSGNLAAVNQANAYDNAIKTWQADNNRAATAAQSYQQSGRDISQLNAQQLKDLLATGGVEQATQQMKLNANYNNYLDQREWSAHELQPLLNATGNKGTPAGVTPPNRASDLLGLGTALAGYYGSTSGGGTTPNTGSGGYTDPSMQGNTPGDLVGLDMPENTIESDRRLKRDIEPLDIHSNGLQSYRFRYLNDDRVFEGYMADEVEKLYPDAVIRRDDGMLLVNYGRIPNGVFRAFH